MFWKKKEPKPTTGFSKSSKPGFQSEETHEELEDMRAPWEKLTSPGVAFNAISWFSDYEAIDLKTDGTKDLKKVHEDFLSSIEDSLDALAEHGDDADLKELRKQLRSIAQDYNPSVIPSLELKLDDCNPVEIHKSKLGKMVIAALYGQGINHVDSSEIVPHEDATGVFVRRGDTPEGNLNIQFIRLYKDENGREFAFWHTPLLASNRPIDYRYIAESNGGDPFRLSNQEASSSPEGRYNLKWGLPAVLKDIAFMAETPFPSTGGLFTFTRDLVFEGLASEARPKPTFAIVANQLFPFVLEPSESTEIIQVQPPNTVLFGWVITEESLQDSSKVLPVVANGCSYALEVVEDGEGYESGVCTGLDWDTRLRQPAVLAATKPDEYGQRYPTQWMTIPEYLRRHLYVTERYNDIYNATNSEERRAGFEDLLENGTDRNVLHAANSLVFGEFLDSAAQSQEELEVALEALAMAFNLDFDNAFSECQATNALSNSGVLYYQAGMLDRAEQHLLQVIERAGGEPEECTNEAEAHFVLSLIYQEQGRKDEADEHRLLGKSYGSGSRLRKPSSGASSSGTIGDTVTLVSAEAGTSKPVSPDLVEVAEPENQATVAKFCGECGTKFEISQAKFCSECGSSR